MLPYNSQLPIPISRRWNIIYAINLHEVIQGIYLPFHHIQIPELQYTYSMENKELFQWKETRCNSLTKQ